MFLHYEHSLESRKSFVRFGNGNSHNQILGRSQDAVIGKVREAQSKLPPTKIARDGSIMEWVSHYFEFRTLLRSYHLLRPMTVIDFENLFIKCGHVYISLWQAQDFEDPDPHHRHVSHLFGLFPGHTITLDKTPDLCKAADYTLFKRGSCIILNET